MVSKQAEEIETERLPSLVGSVAKMVQVEKAELSNRLQVLVCLETHTFILAQVNV